MKPLHKAMSDIAALGVKMSGDTPLTEADCTLILMGVSEIALGLVQEELRELGTKLMQLKPSERNAWWASYVTKARNSAACAISLSDLTNAPRKAESWAQHKSSCTPCSNSVLCQAGAILWSRERVVAPEPIVEMTYSFNWNDTVFKIVKVDKFVHYEQHDGSSGFWTSIQAWKEAVQSREIRILSTPGEIPNVPRSGEHVAWASSKANHVLTGTVDKVFGADAVITAPGEREGQRTVPIKDLVRVTPNDEVARLVAEAEKRGRDQAFDGLECCVGCGYFANEPEGRAPCDTGGSHGFVRRDVLMERLESLERELTARTSVDNPA